MKIKDFKFLTDENIHPQFIFFFKELGFDVKGVRELKLVGASDESLIGIAAKENRVIITQDRDFGKLVYSAGRKFIGIIYLRPGHIKHNFHLGTLNSILESNIDLIVPFIIVAKNENDTVRIRIRNEVEI